ncbi:MAG: cell wall hydrolase [Lachnospiraceae bacterium]|nr:cell wall hydrolase [Lachnospiraceae bacterium]
MNKVIKILLSVMIVSLSAIFIQLEEYSESTETKYVTMQKIVAKLMEIQAESITEVPINFEIDAVIEEMDQKMADIEAIEDKKEWFIAYKNIIAEYSYIIDTPETLYDYFTDEELDLLFHVVQAEIGDKYLFEQKVNVVNVIFNRLGHERFPDTLFEILTADQFSTISSGRYKEVEVSEDTILACEYAFKIEDTTNGCLFFDSNNALNYQFVFNDGAHNFYTLWEERNAQKED